MISEAFAAVFALQGERLTRDPLSEVIRVERGGVNYYVKLQKERD